MRCPDGKAHSFLPVFYRLMCAQLFVNIVMRYDFDIDLVSGRYAVDAKSIMGIFSLDLSKPIELDAHTDDADKFLKDIDKFIIK